MALVPYVSLRRFCVLCTGPATFFCGACESASYCSRSHFDVVSRTTKTHDCMH